MTVATHKSLLWLFVAFLTCLAGRAAHADTVVVSVPAFTFTGTYTTIEAPRFVFTGVGASLAATGPHDIDVPAFKFTGNAQALSPASPAAGPVPIKTPRFVFTGLGRPLASSAALPAPAKPKSLTGSSKKRGQ